MIKGHSTAAQTSLFPNSFLTRKFSGGQGDLSLTFEPAGDAAMAWIINITHLLVRSLGRVGDGEQRT